MKFIYLIICSIILGCAGPPQPSADPAQKAIDLTYNSYLALDAAIKAADAAVKVGKLSGDAGQKAIAGLVAAKAGLDTALLALPVAATAASGVAK